MSLELIPHWYSQIPCFTNAKMVIMQVYEFRETLVIMFVGPCIIVITEE